MLVLQRQQICYSLVPAIISWIHLVSVPSSQISLFVKESGGLVTMQ